MVLSHETDGALELVGCSVVPTEPPGRHTLSGEGLCVLSLCEVFAGQHNGRGPGLLSGSGSYRGPGRRVVVP